MAETWHENTDGDGAPHHDAAHDDAAHDGAAVLAALDNMQGVALPAEPGVEDLTDAAVIPDTDAIRYGFRVASVGLLVMGGVSSEVVDRPAIAKLPKTPSWFLGLCNVRGNLVPVYDLALRLGATREHAWRQILVIDRGMRAVAIPLDRLPEVHAMQRARPVTYQAGIDAALASAVRGSYLIDDECWMVFDHRDYFSRVAAG